MFARAGATAALIGGKHVRETRSWRNRRPRKQRDPFSKTYENPDTSKRRILGAARGHPGVGEYVI